MQQLLSLFRSAVRSFNALIRTSTQLEPGEAATGYTKHLSQCQEVGGALKQLTCASLELGVGSQQTTDEVVNRTEVRMYSYYISPSNTIVCSLVYMTNVRTLGVAYSTCCIVASILCSVCVCVCVYMQIHQ